MNGEKTTYLVYSNQTRATISLLYHTICRCFNDRYLEVKIKKIIKIKNMKKNNIKVLELRDVTIAKVDYKGSFQGIGNAYKKLMKWSKSNGFVNSKTNKTLTIYYDDPNIVGINNVRQSACVIIDKAIESNNDIQIKEFKPGKCAVGRYEISYFQFKDAWIDMTNWIKEKKLKTSGDSFEVYQDKSSSQSNGKTVIDICIPVE